MNRNNIQKITQNIVRLPEADSFAVLGDPGCEGLGTSHMQVYAGALKESGSDDFTLVAGDLVPTGAARYYDAVCAITEAVSENPVYTLRGNHDTGAFETYFGQQNYALIAPHFTVVVIDNANRTFEDAGLQLAAEVLAMPEVQTAVLAFHIPVPNHFTPNAVSEAEFQRLRECYLPYREKVKYMICGHVHSCFVDQVDGIPLICTGGGGAMIEDVSDAIRACDINHHIVHFYEKDGKLCYRFQDLLEAQYTNEQNDPILKEKLEDTVKNELFAHLRYLSFADRARKRGMEAIANLFEALADSEYRHARNFHAILEQPPAFTKTVQTFIPGEQFEYERYYKMMGDYAAKNSAPLSKQAYESAAAAEKTHAELLSEAVQMEDFPVNCISVCPICGFVMEGEHAPERCPVCGGPAAQYNVYRTEK